jgi:hypothetical protein
MTYNTIPALVIAAICDHQVVTLLVVIAAAKPIHSSRWDSCHSIERAMSLDSVANILNWRCFESFVVGAHGCSYRADVNRSISRQQSGIVGTFVMIFSSWSYVHSVDCVWTRKMLLSKMWGSMRQLFFVLHKFQGTFAQRVTTAAVGAIACHSAVAHAAGSSSLVLVRTKCIYTVLTAGTCIEWRIRRAVLPVRSITTSPHTGVSALFRHIQGSSEGVIGLHANWCPGIGRRWEFIV